jgi:glycogen debranching enzyme
MSDHETDTQLSPLGVELFDGGGFINVYSANATSVSLDLLDPEDPTRVVQTVELEQSEPTLFGGGSDLLAPGARYVLRADGPSGPRHAFKPERRLLDPYARGLVRENPTDYHCVVIENEFDWQGVAKPKTPMAQSVIYEAHLRGLTRIHPDIPAEIRGSYAALGHPVTIDYLKNLGITAIELLPIHAIISEPRLIGMGMFNYWGYNSINFFTPHMRYAAEATRAQGPGAIARELKTAIRELHRAGIEVLLDVVYNHSAEGGFNGLSFSYRGLDNSSYYRQDDAGNYIDTTGCGNSFDFSNPWVQRLAIDSLRYWAAEYQIDGYRFDLATTLARDEQNHFDPEHDFLKALRADPVIAETKLIVEPWDVGMGGWQTGNFPPGLSEWNDRYRDSVRKFWLTDIASARASGHHNNSVAELASRMAGSEDIIGDGAGPAGTINFVTAHDGFTLNDLVSYNSKQNSANGEGNRDGSNNNHSFDHGAEGESKNPSISFARRKAARNLMGTLLLSAGVPMITAGDERLKTQGGNNNAYCQDNVISWLSWADDSHALDFEATVRHLIALRKSLPALRPEKFTVAEAAQPGVDQMQWFNLQGEPMSVDDWNNPERRTLQRLTRHLLPDLQVQTLLLVINGTEQVKNVRLARPEAVREFKLLWDSALELPPKRELLVPAGSQVRMVETSMQLFITSGQ